MRVSGETVVLLLNLAGYLVVRERGEEGNGFCFFLLSRDFARREAGEVFSDSSREHARKSLRKRSFLMNFMPIIKTEKDRPFYF